MEVELKDTVMARPSLQEYQLTGWHFALRSARGKQDTCLPFIIHNADLEEIAEKQRVETAALATYRRLVPRP